MSAFSPENLLFSKAVNDSSSLMIAEEIKKLTDVMIKVREEQRKPNIFLKSGISTLSSNVAEDVLILAGLPIPALHRGSIEDFNINFSTAAGTVKLVILDSNKNIVVEVLRDINSSTNGTGKTVLEEGESLAVVGQTAGAGVFTVYCSGDTKKVF